MHEDSRESASRVPLDPQPQPQLWALCWRSASSGARGRPPIRRRRPEQRQPQHPPAAARPRSGTTISPSTRTSPAGYLYKHQPAQYAGQPQLRVPRLSFQLLHHQRGRAVGAESGRRSRLPWLPCRSDIWEGCIPRAPSPPADVPRQLRPAASVFRELGGPRWGAVPAVLMSGKFVTPLGL